MGRHGLAPAPTALKIVRGEHKANRLNHDEPRPTDRLPDKPEDLVARASEVWDRIIRDYAATGVLTAVDGDIFRAYCEAVARYEQASRLLADSGPLIRGARRGELVRNPLHQVVRDNADLMRALARELGFTPSARFSLHGRSAEPQTPMSEYLSRGRRKSA